MGQPKDSQQPLHSEESSASPSRLTINSFQGQTTDGEDTAIRRVAEQLYKSEELPSLYKSGELSPKSELVEIPLIEVDEIYWDHEYDIVNARNWATWKKRLNVGCICLMCILSSSTSTIIAPVIPDIMAHFRLNNAYLSALVLSAFVLGYALGLLFISPLCELVGRVPLYHVCNVIFTTCTALCGRANNVSVLIVLRFFAGVGGSSVFALARSSLADIYAKEERGLSMKILAVGLNLGPTLGPVIGSYVNDACRWRWVFYLTGILGVSVSVLCAICLSESYQPVLLRRKGAHLYRYSAEMQLNIGGDRDPSTSRLKIFNQAMLMPLRMLILSPSILIVSSLTAICSSFVYILYITLPATFVDFYAWQPKNIGLAYLGTAIGNLIGFALGSYVDTAIIRQRAAKGSTLPENRLITMILLWPLVCIGLCVYAWTAQMKLHWILPLIGTVVFSVGARSATLVAGVWILDAYPRQATAGITASSILHALFGGVAPIFVNRFYEKYDVGWTFTLLAMIALVLAPAPFLVYKFGERWRLKEKVNGQTEEGKNTSTLQATTKPDNA